MQILSRLLDCCIEICYILVLNIFVFHFLLYDVWNRINCFINAFDTRFIFFHAKLGHTIPY